jgi:pSer/pThr/pTyr-binding forkhead associated (FHA) protein
LPAIALKQLFMEYLGAPTKFLELHPNPWLVLSQEARPKGDLTLRTNLYATDGQPLDMDAPEDIGTLSAMEIAKGKNNSFGLGITVGRTRNNDLFINDERISRFHAFFQVRDGAWVISDAGSRNGTFVDGTRLDPRRAAPLPARGRVDFGGYRARFFLPPQFVDFLRKATPPPRRTGKSAK